MLVCFIRIMLIMSFPNKVYGVICESYSPHVALLVFFEFLFLFNAKVMPHACREYFASSDNW